MENLTRRDLALAALAVAVPAAGQDQPADDLAAARDRLRQSSEQLRKLRIPIATEPAFAFRP